jgi:hypothetical protein
LPSALAEQLPQLSVSPVHESTGEPHSSAEQVAGVQQVPALPHVLPLVAPEQLPPLHVIGVPQELVVAPHWLAVHGEVHSHSLLTHVCP